MFIIRTNFYQIKVIKIMKNSDQSVKINDNRNWLYILDHHHKLLIVSSSGSGKTNVLLNLKKINDQILIKFIYTSKIHLNHSINCLLMEEKK